MMMLVMTLIAAPSQATSQTSSVSSAQVIKPSADKAEKKVCRSYPVLGNRARVDRICHTRAEWTAVDEANRQAGSQAVERARLGTINNY